jgi:sortase A
LRPERCWCAGPEGVEVIRHEGTSLVALQTCTLPDYEKRLIVQGELVKKYA